MDCYIYRKSIDYKEKEESKEQEEFKQEETTQIKSPHSISLLTEETDLLRSSPYCNMNIEGNVSDRGMIEEKEADEETNTLPSSHVSIHKTRLAILKHKAELHDKLMKQISTNQYVGTDVGNNMIGFGASIIPKAGYEGIAESLPFFIGSFLSNCGISYNPERLVNSLPSNKTIERAVEDNAVSNILLTQDAIRKNLFVYICADKGNKKGNKNLSKFICWYDQSEKKVRTFLIDCDCTNESTIDVTAALNHSLRRVFPSDVSTTVYGQCTDSGGGGTKYALQKALKDLEIAIRTTLTDPNVLFKTKRADEKIRRILSKANENPPPNVYQRRVGQTLTPLIEGRIQYGKLLKRFNLDAVRDELTIMIGSSGTVIILA